MLEPAQIPRFLIRLVAMLFAVTITLLILRPFPSNAAPTYTALVPNEPNQPTQTDATDTKPDSFASCIFIPLPPTHFDVVSKRSPTDTLEPQRPGFKSTPEGLDGSRKRTKFLPRNSRWRAGPGSMKDAPNLS